MDQDYFKDCLEESLRDEIQDKIFELDLNDLTDLYIHLFNKKDFEILRTDIIEELKQ